MINVGKRKEVGRKEETVAFFEKLPTVPLVTCMHCHRYRIWFGDLIRHCHVNRIRTINMNHLLISHWIRFWDWDRNCDWSIDWNVNCLFDRDWYWPIYVDDFFNVDWIRFWDWYGHWYCDSTIHRNWYWHC